VHNSVVVVPERLFQTGHAVAAEAPPYPVPVKETGLDDPSSKLGLVITEDDTVKLNPLLD
jgi:hypothetical protein